MGDSNMSSCVENKSKERPATTRAMTRRKMLHLGFAGVAASLGLSAFKTEAKPTSQMFKTPDFGPEYSVLDTFQEGSFTYVRIGYQGHSFLLKSTDGRTWRTT